METFSALLALCAGNSPVTGEFSTQRPVTRSFDIFFNLRLNIRLSKQSWGWWFEMPLHPLWRRCNEESCSHSILNENITPHCNMKFVFDRYLSRCWWWNFMTDDHFVCHFHRYFYNIWQFTSVCGKYLCHQIIIKMDSTKGTDLEHAVQSEVFPQWPLLLTWFNFNPSMDK